MKRIRWKRTIKITKEEILSLLILGILVSMETLSSFASYWALCALYRIWTLSLHFLTVRIQQFCFIFAHFLKVFILSLLLLCKLYLYINGFAYINFVEHSHRCISWQNKWIWTYFWLYALWGVLTRIWPSIASFCVPSSYLCALCLNLIPILIIFLSYYCRIRWKSTALNWLLRDEMLCMVYFRAKLFNIWIFFLLFLKITLAAQIRYWLTIFE